MDERCQQFHVDAQRPRDAKTPKEIDRLRKFLFKNQDHRFTDRAQSYLFQAIQCHVTACSGSSSSAAAKGGSGAGDEDADNPALALVEDALKMPFTVFTTSQKKAMLKWLEKLKPGNTVASAPAGGTQGTAQCCTWSVMSVTDTHASVMNDEGDERDVQLAGSDHALVQQLRQLFDAGEAVALGLDYKGTSITHVVTLGG